MENAALHEPNLPWKMVAQYLVAHGYGVIEAPVLTGLSEKPSPPKRENFADDDQYEQENAIYRAQSREFNPIRIRVPHP